MNELLEQAETLQNLLTSHATGGAEGDADYRQLRSVFISNPSLERLLPRFVRTSRSLSQFWEYIKHECKSYSERRVYIWEEFIPLIQSLERGAMQPSDENISDALQQFDPAHVHAAWSKALDRRDSDPEGAITSARTLLESVCKHIIDDMGESYHEKGDLPKLYKATANTLVDCSRRSIVTSQARLSTSTLGVAMK
jgi:hypothetical protein